ncbi:MAG: hypothetical protein QM778_24485 [Myxococcales bacterium]
MRKFSVFPILGFVACLALGSAHAQAPKPAEAAPAPSASPGDDAKKEASGHFRRAVELYQEGAFRAALVEFQRAYDIAPDYRLLYNIGQAQLQVQDYLGATRSYERYLAEGGTQVSPERRTEVETALGALKERVARLAIRVNLDDAEVFVDDQAVGRSPLANTVAVNVGRHRVFARTADGVEGERIIDVAGGDLAEIAVELIPKVTQAPVAVAAEPAKTERAPLSRKKRAALATWGVAAATGIGAIITGVLATSKTNDLDDALDVKPPKGEANQGKVSDLRDSANALAITTDVLAATALASGVTGLVLWLVDGKADQAAEEKPAATQVSWGVGLGTLSVKGKF